jgi:hypothetical protein
MQVAVLVLVVEQPPVQVAVLVLVVEQPLAQVLARVQAALLLARPLSHHTYHRNDSPPPVERHMKGRPVEPPQAQAPPDPAPRRSYRRTPHRQPPTPRRQSTW